MSAMLHGIIAVSYNRLFIAVPPADRDFIVDCITVLTGIQVYRLFTGIFKQDVKSFSNRFLIDCIHFVV